MTPRGYPAVIADVLKHSARMRPSLSRVGAAVPIWNRERRDRLHFRYLPGCCVPGMPTRLTSAARSNRDAARVRARLDARGDTCSGSGAPNHEEGEKEMTRQIATRAVRRRALNETPSQLPSPSGEKTAAAILMNRSAVIRALGRHAASRSASQATSSSTGNAYRSTYDISRGSSSVSHLSHTTIA